MYALTYISVGITLYCSK